MAASTTPGTCVLIQTRGRGAGRPQYQTPLRHGRRRRVVGFRRGEQVLELAAQLAHLLARRGLGRRTRRRRGRCLFASGHRLYISVKLAQTASNAPKGCSVLLLQPMARGASEMPCSNECPSTPALTFARPSRMRYDAPGRVSGPRAENPCSSSRSQAQRTDNEAAFACPFASTRRGGSHATHARLPAAPTAALRSAGAAPYSSGLLRCSYGAAAQPHAREHHAQHIMNQARAHQKASRAVCAIRVGREHAVEQYIRRIDGVWGSHRWRTGPPRA